METIVFGDYTVLDIIIAAGVVIGCYWLWNLLKRVLNRNKVASYAQRVICFNCGWEGQVSKHAGRCPKCNKRLGDQKAKEYKKS